MRLFVTGSTGFIGSHFLRTALASGHDITALRLPGTEPVVPLSLVRSSCGPAVRFLDGSLDGVSVEQLSRHDGLVHLAAYGVSPQPCTWQKALQINVLDSILLMERAIEAEVPRIILSGSSMEYGSSAERFENIPPHAPLEPTGPYAASKAALSIAASALCQQKGVELAILRLFTVFGEGQNPSNLWPSMHRAALAGEDFPMSPGEQISDFVPVEAVARSFMRALELPSSAFNCSPSLRNHSTLVTRHSTPLVANIGTGRPQTIRSFAEHWWTKWNAKGRLRLGALPYRDNEIMRYVPEVSPLFAIRD